MYGTNGACGCGACAGSLGTDFFGSAGSMEAVSAPSDARLAATRWGSGPMGTSGGTVTFSFGNTTVFDNRLKNFTAGLSDQFKTYMRMAFQRWEQVANIDFVEVADASNVNIRVGMAPIDGRGGTAGYAYFPTERGGVRMSDIWFDASESQYFSTTSPSWYQLALHEIGHAIGLDHATTSGVLMSPSVTVADLTADDIAGARQLYGAPGVATPAPSAPATGPVAAGNTVYRFFNTSTQTYFYTASNDERASVQSLPQFQYDGPVFRVAAGDAAGTLQVYRFFNGATGTHFFTASAAERDQVRATVPGLSYEGVAYNAYAQPAAGTTPLFRFFNTANGSHFYTASTAERDSLQAAGSRYNFEGTAYYVLAA